VSAPRRIARIAVSMPSWTGDVVMATPGLRALRRHFPDARISALVRAPIAPLLAGSPSLDAVVPVAPWRAAPRDWLCHARRLRGERIELGVCLPDSVSSALFLRLAGAARIVGHRRGLRDALLDQAVAVPAEWGRRRVVARERKVLHLLAAVGVAGHGTELELATTPEEEARAERALAAWATHPRLVVLAPGASFGPAKLWPAARFAGLGDALAAEGAAVALVGSEGVRDVLARAGVAMRLAPGALQRRLDAGALKAVVRRAALVVCNDAGLRHVAVAFATPAVAIFGPTSLEKTDCNLEGVTVLGADVACRPCHARVCPIDHRCMTAVEVEHVLQAARSALAVSAA